MTLGVPQSNQPFPRGGISSPETPLVGRVQARLARLQETRSSLLQSGQQLSTLEIWAIPALTEPKFVRRFHQLDHCPTERALSTSGPLPTHRLPSNTP